MSRAGDACTACFYCDLELNTLYHEHDHAPVPNRHGGTQLVPACYNCHKLKDVILYDHWPAAPGVLAVRALVARDILPTGTEESFPECWAELTMWPRLLWAKLAWVAMDCRRDGEVPSWLSPEAVALGVTAREQLTSA